MAKFYMEDGSTKNGDAIYDEWLFKQLKESCVKSYEEEERWPAHMELLEISKLKEPHGDKNYRRLGNVSKYDMLIHIQQTLNVKNLCIIDIITGHNMKCPNHSKTIDMRVEAFASKEITEELKSRYPKMKDDNGVEESDESYMCRLCHIIMHHNHPRMLQMIKCEECIQAWMNSDKW